MRQFISVPRIFSGPGAGKQLPVALDASHFPRRLLIICDRGLHESGVVVPILDALAASAYEYEVFDGVSADPPEGIVLDALAAGHAYRARGVVGIGGGSSLDVAKVVAALLYSGQQPAQIYGADRVAAKGVPLMQVPTTAGTGSEMTAVAVLTTPAGQKKSAVSEYLRADAVVLDPLLCVSLPPRATAMTGLDAIVHAIEACTNQLSKNALSDLLAREALRLLCAALPRAFRDGSDLEARTDMLLGAMLAGMAFANSPVGAVHALAYPVGSRFHVPHGLSNALLLPHVLRFNLPACQATYAQFGELLVPGVGTTEAQRASAFLAFIDDLLGVVGLACRLSDVGVIEADLPTLASDAMMQTRLLANNPRAVNIEDALSLYRMAL